MADNEKVEQKENKEEKKEKKEKKGKKETTKTEENEKKSFVALFLPKIIIVVVVVFFAGVGFTLGRMFAGPSTINGPLASQNGQTPGLENIAAEGSEDYSQGWYYHLDPVIANLNVADVTRYVKASLTLEVSSEIDKREGADFLDENKPILTNWLTVYLASLGIDDIRGDNNLKRIQSQVLDAFNEKLFPDSKPGIKNILFKEFAVQ